MTKTYFPVTITQEAFDRYFDWVLPATDHYDKMQEVKSLFLSKGITQIASETSAETKELNSILAGITGRVFLPPNRKAFGLAVQLNKAIDYLNSLN